MNQPFQRIFLARHAETEWSLTGKHTGRSDPPLTERGRHNALHLGNRLTGRNYAAVFTSPSSHARQTCELAGFASTATIDPDLQEWDYGHIEGKRRPDILQARPGWQIFRDGAPGGESTAQISARADRVIAKIRAVKGDVLIFSSGHFLRALAVRWLALPVSAGAMLVLHTATLSILGYEHDLTEPAIVLWNDDSHLRG